MRGHTPRGSTVEPVAVTADSPLSFWYRNQDSTLRRHGRNQHRVHSPSSPGTAAIIVRICRVPAARARAGLFAVRIVRYLAARHRHRWVVRPDDVGSGGHRGGGDPGG
jgi:hypothetical protein